MPGGQLDHLGAEGAVADQQARRRAARLAIGRGQRMDAPEHGVGRRRVIGDRARRAARGAGAAARADHRVDAHMIAGRGDRAGRADVQALGAARLLGPRMGANQRLHRHVERFFEGADQLRGLQDRVGHRRQAAGIGAQVAFALLRGGEHRRAARQVQDHVAVRGCPVARRTPCQRAAPGGIDLLQRVDLQAELAKRPLGAAQMAADHVEIAGLGRLGLVGQQHGHAQHRSQLAGRVHRHVRRPDHQAQPLRDHVERLLGGHRQGRLGHQRGHFG